MAKRGEREEDLVDHTFTHYCLTTGHTHFLVGRIFSQQVQQKQVGD